VTLHRNYQFCLKGAVEDFLKAETPSTEGEFCVEEKKKYFDFMASNM